MSKRDYIVKKYRKAIDFAREYLASDIVIYYKTGEIDCPLCNYDPISKEGDNPYCICSGLGKIETIASKTVSANISRRGISSEYQQIIHKLGILDRGDYVVSCKIDDVLVAPNDPTGPTYFDIAKYIMVNNMKCYLDTTPMRYGLAGDVYSCAAVLRLEETPSN